MPTARIEEDGVLRLGYSRTDPYSTLWSSISFFPRLELSGRYTVIDGVQQVEDQPEFGDYDDKAFDAKLLLFRESQHLPEVSLGVQDFIGTRLFPSEYVAVSKRVGDVDVTVGYGKNRIDGMFGGLRYKPSWNPNLGLVAEYDATDYKHDFGADQSGADQRTGGATYAVEYRFGWVGLQVSYQGGEVGANAYVSIPLMEKEFVPKIEEPEPYSAASARPSLEEWRSDPQYAKALGWSLDQQGFRNIYLRLDGKSLEASLTHTRISLIGRAVGRAARALLLLGPRDIETIEITYTLNDLPVVTYAFRDLRLLQEYFAGGVPGEKLEQTVEIGFTSPEYGRQFRHVAIGVFEKEEADPGFRTLYGDEGHAVSFKREDRFLSSARLIPFNLRFYFNDPSGAFKYDTFALGAYSKHFGGGLFLDSAVRLTLVENVSDVTISSNSVLPHVRSDIADYKREGDSLRLNSLLLNQYAHPAQRVYGRLSAGYYEEMYAGAGGQLLYLPKDSDWAADFSVDWLKQREPGNSFGFTDYSTTTALGALHYRFSESGITVTGRAGRFLARDEGVRLEFKRRFRSGVELGGWYTVTNEKDITSPGSPEDPYYDKGLFVRIPLNSMLTKDTQQTASLSLAPWTRDVGQMVESPGDLYRMFERRLLLNSAEHDLLTDFAN